MTGVALLGAGRMAKVHAHAIKAVGGRVAAIYDPISAVADALANKTGAASCVSAKAAIDHLDADVVMVATSSDTHTDLIIASINAGKPVFCEKPLSDSLSEARRCIQSIGQEAARRVFLGFNRRFDDGHAALREKTHAGEIGTLEQLTITSRDPAPPPLDYIPRSGGLFRDMMIHDFDMARAITGQEPISITAHGSSIIDPEIGQLGDVDTATVTMTMPDGAIVIILNSRRCVYGYDQRIEAFGSQGMLLSDNARKSALVQYSGTHHGTAAPLADFFMERYGASYENEIRTFLECAEAGRDMPVNAMDGLRAMLLADAATVSCKTGQTVALTGLEQEFADA